jgi:hypothetical protein
MPCEYRVRDRNDGDGDERGGLDWLRGIGFFKVSGDLMKAYTGDLLFDYPSGLSSGLEPCDPPEVEKQKGQGSKSITVSLHMVLDIKI